MDTNEILKQILSNTFTKADCYRRLLCLQDFFDQTGYGGESPKTALTDTLLAAGGAGGPEHSERASFASSDDAAAVAAWGEAALAELQKERETVADIKRRIETLPEMVLYVPCALGTAGVARVGAWCRANVHPEVLLVLHVDSVYAGGCAVVWKDLFYDFSLPYFFTKHDQQLKSLLSDLR